MGEQATEICAVSSTRLLEVHCEADLSAHFTKLQGLFENIFEESDAFSAEPTEEELSSSRYFSVIHPTSSLPLLADSAVEKITRNIVRIQKGKRRQSLETMEWDSDTIGRVLRLLERSLTGLEGIEPFPFDRQAPSKKKGKGKVKKEKAEDKTPEVEEAGGASQEASEMEIEEGEDRLQLFRRGGSAAECVLTLLDTEGLSKQVRSLSYFLLGHTMTYSYCRKTC